MRTCIYSTRSAVCFVLAVSLMCPADLPVRKIILYKHGIGYFERSGTLKSGEEARLDFKTSDMNDVLKSLTVTDRSGQNVSGIRYDSNAPLDQQLQSFPFQIGRSERLSAFLDNLRGARLQVKARDGDLAGIIVSARALSGDDRTSVREQLTLMSDSGDLTNIDLAQVSSFRLADPEMQQKLKDYLQLVVNAQTRDKRSLYIDSAGSAARDLKVSYTAPVAIWKSSYRLNLSEPKPTLEGWAIVDNTTDEDWNNVAFSVVSGRPISFISLLDTPRFGSRRIEELSEDAAAGPVVYAGDINGLPVTAESGVVGGVMGAISGSPPPPPPLLAPKAFAGNRAIAKSEVSTVQGASGAVMGELFEYGFVSPVTIKSKQSAMLPFLQGQIAARKLLIYRREDGEYPVNAAEVTNSSGKTLDGGPITVYDGGAYAGEALVETFKAGDKRLIGYAVDFGTRVTTAFDSGSQNTLKVRAEGGSLTIETAVREITTYDAKNVDAKSKTLLVEQEQQEDYKLLSPKPVERTAHGYRFEISIAGNSTQSLKVERERITSEVTEVNSSAPDRLLAIVSGTGISDAGRTQLQQIIALKRRAADAQTALDVSKSAMDELTQDQTRLRQNIDSLNRVSGQEDKVRQYSSRLNDNEVKLATLRDKRNELKQNLASLTGELDNAITKLRF